MKINYNGYEKQTTVEDLAKDCREMVLAFGPEKGRLTVTHEDGTEAIFVPRYRISFEPV